MAGIIKQHSTKGKTTPSNMEMHFMISAHNTAKEAIKNYGNCTKEFQCTTPDTFSPILIFNF